MSFERLERMKEWAEDERELWKYEPREALKKLARNAVGIGACAVVYGATIGAGAIRGYHGEPMLPNNGAEFTVKDYVEAGAVTAVLGGTLIDCLREPYSRGSQMTALGLFIAPAFFLAVHGVGYAAGTFARRALG